MSDSDRVQRWRQRMRAEGKEPLTVWLTTAEKLRLEDMALRQRCSPSELVQSMLAQWHGASQAVSATVTDTEQIRAIVQHELAQTHIGTSTVTDTVTATLQQTLPGLVRALLDAQQPGSVTATVTDTSTDHGDASRPATAPECVTDTVPATVVVPMTYPVTDTVTDTDMAPRAKRKASRQSTVTDTVADTVPVTEAKHRGRKPVLRPGILAVLDAHPEGLTAAELKVYLGTEKHIGDTLSGMARDGLLVKLGQGQGLRYQRADTVEASSRH